MRPADARSVRRAVERWAATLDRPLPWRGERDAYRVLVSEVMLQQTQAARVAEAYPRFLARFPTAPALARASSADVLRAWGNLGYNRRPLALWRACRHIAGSGFPRSVEALERLPGVGPYTARAVASFAFGRRVGAVDANVRRLLTRIHGLAAGADVQALADGLVPRGRAAVWNQAMIDLGATVCRPRSPSCAECPLERWCAYARGVRGVDRAKRSDPPISAGHGMHPAFETTSRYVRGRVVAELRRACRPVQIAALQKRVGVSARRFRRALVTLERDGIVSVRDGRIALGGYLARERSSSGSVIR